MSHYLDCFILRATMLNQCLGIMICYYHQTVKWTCLQYDWSMKSSYGCFRKWWYPQIIHFNGDFHINHPFWGTPNFGNTHVGASRIGIPEDPQQKMARLDLISNPLVILFCGNVKTLEINLTKPSVNCNQTRGVLMFQTSLMTRCCFRVILKPQRIFWRSHWHYPLKFNLSP